MRARPSGVSCAASSRERSRAAAAAGPATRRTAPGPSSVVSADCMSWNRVPEPDAAREHPAHRQRTGDAVGVLLDQLGRHQPTQRRPPGQHLARSYGQRVEDGDLVVEGLLDRPPRARVGRARQRVAPLQQDVAGETVGCGHGRVRRAREHCAVGVQQQRAVPGRGRLDGPGRTVGERPRRGRDGHPRAGHGGGGTRHGGGDAQPEHAVPARIRCSVFTAHRSGLRAGAAAPGRRRSARSRRPARRRRGG